MYSNLKKIVFLSNFSEFCNDLNILNFNIDCSEM